MIVGIKIMPREVILDSQGRAIENSMKNNGFQVHSVRAGKFLELNLPENNQEKAREQVEKMLRDGGLYNPLIEKFDILINSAGDPA